MKPSTKFWIGLFIAIIGMLFLGFSPRLAIESGVDHVLAFGIVGMVLGLLLICFGVWFSGVRIKFPPKKDSK
jgi:hypothetical protein